VFLAFEAAAAGFEVKHGITQPIPWTDNTGSPHAGRAFGKEKDMGNQRTFTESWSDHPTVHAVPA
jgi:hypothetical protein